MKNLYAIQSKTSYEKALIRLEKSISSGQFIKYTQQKKQQLWNRICRYARQLGIRVKGSIATACVAAGLCFSSSATAQTFVNETGANNPFDGIDVGKLSAPAFADLDGDGDKDAFLGDQDGKIVYYKNTGTATAPVFILQTGIDNPLLAVSSEYTSITFADIDGDGDLDAFVGSYYDKIMYYENTGTSTSPVFTLQTESSDPVDAIVDIYSASSSFADIDGDGDLDLFIGRDDGTIRYFENTGTVNAPVFTEQTGSNNPLNGVDSGDYATTSLTDIDGDGDLDFFVGAEFGAILFYRNTGTSAAPVFTAETGSSNPYSNLGRAYGDGYYSKLAFVDIDGDGDTDAFLGDQDGTLTYYRNTTASLPLRIVNFSGASHAGYNEIQWETATELNTKSFEVQSSINGRNFTKVAAVNTAGNGDNSYSIKDNNFYSGKVFYRLKMIDADGRFTYSSIIWISVKAVLSIYPNPATNVININIGGTLIPHTSAGIYDAAGKLMQRIIITTNQQQVNIQALAKGTYTVKFSDGKVQSFLKN